MYNDNIPIGYEWVEDERPWLSYHEIHNHRHDDEPLEHCEIHDRDHNQGCPDCYNEDISEL